MFCSNCGSRLPDGGKLCPNCGASAENPAPSAPVPAQQNIHVVIQPPPALPRSRVAYVLLAFFFGWAGIHNFYAGRTGSAVAQLLMSLLSCGLLVPAVGIWVIVEMLAVSRDGRGVPMSGNGVVLAVILLVVSIPLMAILVFAAGIRLPAPNQARDRGWAFACASNLKQIGIGLAVYASEYDSWYPPQNNAAGLNLLEIPTDQAFYICPATDTVPANGELADIHCDYLYLGGAGRFDWVEDCPVAFERPGSHRNNFINVLYGDGRVTGSCYPASVSTPKKLLEYLERETANPKAKAFLKAKTAEF